MQPNNADDTIANLDRLAQKAGVRATLVLSRHSGAIVQSTGLERADTSNAAADRISEAIEHSNTDSGQSLAKLKPVEDIVRLVFDYVKASAAIAKEMNTSPEDDLRLLRLRTKRNELVIVPDEHYIAVVIHDTPPA